MHALINARELQAVESTLHHAYEDAIESLLLPCRSSGFYERGAAQPAGGAHRGIRAALCELSHAVLSDGTVVGAMRRGLQRRVAALDTAESAKWLEQCVVRLSRAESQYRAALQNDLPELAHALIEAELGEIRQCRRELCGVQTAASALAI